MNNLPQEFEGFSEARRKGFVTVKNLKDKGKNVVGVFCTYTPWEIIAASGALPVGLCGKNDETIPDAEKVLPRNLCPLIKSSYGFALTEKCPYTYFSDLIVGETTCDGKKKMYEFLNDIRPVHVMQLPQVQNTKDAFNLWRNEIIRLKETLGNKFNIEITEEKIREMIKIRNNERKALKAFYELGKLCPPPVTGLEIMKVLTGSGFRWDKNEEIKSLKSMVIKAKDDYESGKRKVPEMAKRILITGCPMGEGVQKIIELIEQNGGVVVVYENCSGVKEIGKLVDENKDPIDALTEKYLSIPCSCMSPNNARFESLSELIDDYKVDGVVDVILQACHTYNVETAAVKQFINKEKNIPYISIETDYSQTDIGQLKTRISAFIEML